jgi:hypothetical protein
MASTGLPSTQWATGGRGGGEGQTPREEHGLLGEAVDYHCPPLPGRRLTVTSGASVGTGHSAKSSPARSRTRRSVSRRWRCPEGARGRPLAGPWRPPAAARRRTRLVVEQPDCAGLVARGDAHGHLLQPLVDVPQLRAVADGRRGGDPVHVRVFGAGKQNLLRSYSRARSRTLGRHRAIDDLSRVCVTLLAQWYK